MNLVRRILKSMRRSSDASNSLSADMWDRMRSCDGRRAPGESSRVHDLLRSSSWLAMVCCAESVDPNSLGLSEERYAALREEVTNLRTLNPLELYVGCLERLAESDPCRSEGRTC